MKSFYKSQIIEEEEEPEIEKLISKNNYKWHTR